MEITRRLPLDIDVIPVPGSTIICEFTLNGSKSKIKVNTDLIIYYKNPHQGHITHVIASGTQTIYTSIEKRAHIIKLKVPQFKNRIRSFVNISVDDVQSAFIEDLIVEEESKYYTRKRDTEEQIKARKERHINKIYNIFTGKEKPDIICEGLMFGHSGFAKAMRNMTIGLDKIGCNTKSVVLDNDSIGFLDTEKGKILDKLRLNDINEPLFWITMNNPMGVQPHQNCYSIGYVMFETENFPIMYADHLKKQNEIWTPSNFCRDSMIRSGLSKVFVMPLGVDIDQFNPKNVEPLERHSNLTEKYIFLTVMGYSERKGVSILVRAFAEEFKKNEDVALYIKGGWYDENKAQKEIKEMIQDISNPPLIHIDFNIYSDDILAKIYKMSDCFVLPTRGEGWGLPIIEAMSMEMPTISTRWGGQLEFMNDDNSYLIDIDGIRPEPKCDWICKEYIGGKFAVPNKDHLKRLMRHIFENTDDAKLKGKIAREYVTKNFSWERSCNRMYDRLKIIIKDMYTKEITSKNLNN